MRSAEATGMDATESVGLASRAMEDAGIEADEYSRVLDMAAKTSQVSGIAQDTPFLSSRAILGIRSAPIIPNDFISALSLFRLLYNGASCNY